MLWTLGTDRVFKNPQRRDKCEDIAVAQFWVRNARSLEECYLGKKRTQEKKQYSWGRILRQMFHFRGSDYQRVGPPGWLTAALIPGSLRCTLVLRPKARTERVSDTHKSRRNLISPLLLSPVLNSLVQIPSIRVLHFFHPFKQLLSYILARRPFHYPVSNVHFYLRGQIMCLSVDL